MERTVLHSDLNNFFASVECYLNPGLRGHPVAVAGNPEARHGIVLAKNYEAKAFGVATGEALWEARLKCPDIIFVPPHYDKYFEYSQAVRAIYSEYTDLVEPYGLDECWLDVTGSGRLFGNGIHIADELRGRIRKELGVTVSVGVSYNKIFAKLGSDMKKPDATTVIDRAHFRETVWPLPVGDLLYIGRSSVRRLKQYNINTIGELAAVDETLLAYLLGKNGLMLRMFANGDDTSPVSNIAAKSLVKSVSCGSTAPRDLVTDEDVKILLLALSTKVSKRLREYGFCARCIQILIRDKNLSCYERQTRLEYPCRTSEAVFEAAMGLYKANHTSGIPIRSISVRACELDFRESEQMSFMPELFRIQRRETLECAFDRLRSKFGEGIIGRGVLMTAPELCDTDLKSEPGILPGMMNRK